MFNNEIQKEKSNILVIGLGGGADAQGASALALHLKRLYPTSNILYGTAFDVTKLSKNTGDECYEGAFYLPFSNKDSGEMEKSEILQLHPKKYTFSEYNDMVNGIPKWVNTLMYEQGIDQHEFQCDDNGNGGVGKILSPIVACLDKNDGLQQERLVKQLNQLAQWDLIIGLDHGGDVFGGIEDQNMGTDIFMARKLLQVAEAQGHNNTNDGKGVPFKIVIHGLCIDGENYYENMTKKLMLGPLRYFEGTYSIKDMMDILYTMCTNMQDSKTTKIVLKGLNDELKIVKDKYNGIVDPFDTKTIYDTNIEESTEKRDCFGMPILKWVESIQRFHKDKNGILFPPGILPSHWITTGFIFDGRGINRYLLQKPMGDNVNKKYMKHVHEYFDNRLISDTVEDWQNLKTDSMIIKEDKNDDVDEEEEDHDKKVMSSTSVVHGTLNVPGNNHIHAKPAFQFLMKKLHTLRNAGGSMIKESTNCIAIIPAGFRGGETINTLNPVREDIGGLSALMSVLHILVLPKSIRRYHATTLRYEDIPLLEEMKLLGTAAVHELIDEEMDAIGSLSWQLKQDNDIKMKDGTSKSAKIIETDIAPSCRAFFNEIESSLSEAKGSEPFAILQKECKHSSNLSVSFHITPHCSVGWLHMHIYSNKLLTTAHDHMESAAVGKTVSNIPKNMPYSVIKNNLNEVLKLQESLYAESHFKFQDNILNLALFLDVDDTVLKEVAFETYKDRNEVQLITYKPSKYVLGKYISRLNDAQKKPVVDRKKVIHYKIHDDGETITSAVVVRPCIFKLLILTGCNDNIENRILVSANDDNRTNAVLEQVLIGDDGKTLKDWGFCVCPRDVSINDERKKDVTAIRKWASIQDNCATIFIDDKCEDIVNNGIIDYAIPCEKFGSTEVLTYLETGDEISSDDLLVETVNNVLQFVATNIKV